jgi:hypothetical protein
MRKPALAFCIAAMLVLLCSCTIKTTGPGGATPELRVIDQSATATSSVPVTLLSYQNSACGFAFTYPDTWTVTEQAGSATRNPQITLVHPEATLVVEYGLLHEIQGLQNIPPPSREDMELSPLNFFGQSLPVIEYLDGGRVVMLALPAIDDVFLVDDLFFHITMLPPDGSADEADFSDSLLDEALGIVESFSAADRENAAADPYGDWQAYLSMDYGLLLRYPDAWLLEEIDWEVTPGLYEKALSLKKDNIQLLIGYHFKENYLPHAEDFQGGLLVDDGTALFLGEEIARFALQYEGIDKEVFYHGLDGLESGGLVFTLRLRDTTPGTSYKLIQVPDQEQMEAEGILASLRQFAPQAAAEEARVISQGKKYFLSFETCFDLDGGTQKAADDITCDVLLEKISGNTQKVSVQPLNGAVYNFINSFDGLPDFGDCVGQEGLLTVRKTELELNQKGYCYQTSSGRYGAFVLQGMTADGVSFDWQTGSTAGELPLASVRGSGTWDAGVMVKDMTIPDGTVMSPGETFTKTWQLVNKGTSTWTTDYAVRFESGDRLGAAYETALSSNVPPEGAVNISVEMTAPMEPGEYTGHWVLRNVSGQSFGLGEDGSKTFWVTIVVEE